MNNFDYYSLVHSTGHQNLSADQPKLNISNRIKKLEAIHKSDLPALNQKLILMEIIEKIVFKISHFLQGIFSGKSLESSRFIQANRAQEHLLDGSGSSPDIHYKFLLKVIDSCDNPIDHPDNTHGHFKRLYNEIKQLETDNALTSINPKADRQLTFNGEQNWANKKKKELSELETNQSLWISIPTPGQATMMRIEKNEIGHFNLYFSNTGDGILENQDFHHYIIEEDGTERARLVAMIADIPKNALLNGDFLQNLVHAMDTGENSEAALNTVTLQVKETSPTNVIYRELRTLLKDGATLNPEAHNDESFWGRMQQTASSSVSCILAMAKTLLNVEEYQLLETQIQVKSLVKHYRLLKSGMDRSATRKIMILDLIQPLKRNLLEEKDKETLLKIEQEIKTSLEMSETNDAEIKIAKYSRVKIDDFISQGENGNRELSGFIFLISNRKHGMFESFTTNPSDFLDQGQKSNTLTAHLRMYKTQRKYDLNADNTGVDFFDKLALVCFHVANGDYKKTEESMNDLLNWNGEVKRTENPKYIKQMLKKQLGIEYILLLLTRLISLDHTRSGTAKLLFLTGLLIQLKCKKAEMNFQKVQKELWKMSDSDFNDSAVKKQFNENIDKTTQEEISKIIKEKERIINTEKERIVNKENEKEEIKNRKLVNRKLRQKNVEIKRLLEEGRIEKARFKTACTRFCHIKKIFANLDVKHCLNDQNIWLRGLEKLEMTQPLTQSEFLHGNFPTGLHLSEQLENVEDSKTKRVATKLFEEI